jgi:hypothetical protein
MTVDWNTDAGLCVAFKAKIAVQGNATSSGRDEIDWALAAIGD